MCGIAGILHFNEQPVAYSQLKKMTDAIAHRGPDGEGHFIDGALGFGHRRLAIIDLTPAGHQPMQTKDGRYVLTYNGEIYNFHELRIELEALGYLFHSKTDSEVVLNAFAAWGSACIQRFNGMFAFAVWDKEERVLFLGRDRYGIKPLYYFLNSKHCIFASEVKAIIASGLYDVEIDKESLVEYLSFQNFFTNKTLFKNIKTLNPGHYIKIGSMGAFSKTEYWDFHFEDGLKLTEEEATEELERLFRQAVQRQLISDVPVNSYLSGGIDSGAITMLASQHVPHMRSFTIGFDLSSASGLELAFDERAKAEHISYFAKTEHYEMVLKAGDMERCMNTLVWHLEEPRVGQSYPNYYAAKLASKFGKVVLSGIGGDELFGGYPWRYFYSDTPKSMHEFADEYYLKWQRLLPNSILRELLKPIESEIQHVWTRDIFAAVLEKGAKRDLKTAADFLNASLYLEAKTFLHGLLVVEDKLSMAHGLETRVPFLDNDLVDFATKLPFSLKIKKFSEILRNVDENRSDQKRIVQSSAGKYVLRNALRKYLPTSFLNAQKQGFSAPDASWFKGESIDYVKEILLSKKLSLGSFLNTSLLEKILTSHFDGQQNKRLLIWSLLYIEHFLKIFHEASSVYVGMDSRLM